jgi:tRNA (guanine-N7-)-methyltransferase
VSIRTYKPRRGRVTPRQATAIGTADDLLLELTDAPLPIALIWGGAPLVLEIGFGTGGPTAQMAAADPSVGLLAIDVHTPGIGDLLHRVRSEGLTNVRVMEADALEVLRLMIAPDALSGVRTYFPDPWPKARHHKRRIVTPSNATLIGSRCRVGAFWHLATDWAPYADSMRTVLDAHPMWSGGIIERPDARPVTRYEETALRQERSITDLLYTRCAG